MFVVYVHVYSKLLSGKHGTVLLACTEQGGLVHVSQSSVLCSVTT